MHWSYQTPCSNNRREDSTHGQDQMFNIEIKLIIFIQPKMEKLLQSAKRRLGADCGSDHELLIAKFRLKLKKVGKTTRPLRDDLNQIPCDYTVEGTNKFKGLGLIGSVWKTMDGGLWHCTGDRDQQHPQEKEMQKRRNGCLRRPYK